MTRYGRPLLPPLSGPRSRRAKEGADRVSLPLWRRITASCLVAAALAVAIPPTRAVADAASFETFAKVNSNELESAEIRQRLAEQYSLVVIRGTLNADHISDLRQRRSSMTILAYEQGAGLSHREVAELEASNPEWIARDGNGNYITPKNFVRVTLADLTDPGYRSWKAERVAAEVALTDGAYLDTLAAFFPDGFYTARPHENGAPITDMAWRDGSADLIRLVQERTARSVVVNGFGLGSGTAYLDHRADADVLVNQADGVHIENFTRRGEDPVDLYDGELSWLNDIDFLRLLGQRGKIALAYTEVNVPATEQQLEQWRDYGLGTFLLGFEPRRAHYGFQDHGTPALTSQAAWAVDLGSPRGPRIAAGSTQKIGRAHV